jgi:hypothetical protein
LEQPKRDPKGIPGGGVLQSVGEFIAALKNTFHSSIVPQQLNITKG